MRIGVFGLSGVGKSYLVEHFTATNTDFIGTRASQLISEASNEISFNALTTDIVDDNQKALIIGFENFCQRHINKNIIIELHNLIELPNNLVEIDDNVLYSLRLNAVCFLSLSPEKIFEHRIHDTSRVRPKKSVMDLKHLQNHTLSKFKATFSGTGIPFNILSENHLKKFSLFINKLEPL